MRKACLDCGVPFTPRFAGDARCARCRPDHSHRSPDRDRRKQERMRDAVLKRDGYRCTYVDPESGERCTETDDLRCCHIIPLHELKSDDPIAYDPDNGVTRCGTHDRMTDPYAR